MHRTRLVVVALFSALIVAAVPASAGTNDWGTWAFTGHDKSWSGTFYDAHRVYGVVMGLKSLVKYNSVTAFKIAGKTCKISTERGTGYCYTLDIPANKKVKWTLTTRKNVASSDGLVPCIKFNGKYHCRYGNA
jgi:hypothetical protein